MNFHILSKGDKGVNSCKINGDVVSLQHQTVHPKIAPRETGQRISLKWAFDFTGVSRNELLELAARNLVITFRAPFKTLDAPEPKDWNDVTFNVRKWIDDEKRKPADKLANAKKLVSSMTEAEKAALLAQLTGETNDEE